MMADSNVLILGTADWNQPIATNQHYIAAALAEDYFVAFVESIGLRRPSLRARDLRRIARRLGPKRASTEGRPIPAGMVVISPRVIPLHVRPLRAINKRLLRTAVEAWLRRSSPRILWCYSPLSYGLERYADVVVYHCVDLLGEVPGIDAEMIATAESALARAGTLAIGSSPGVVEHLQEVGFAEPLFWPNVADTSVFASARRGDGARSGVVFAGNLTETKVDFELLERVVARGEELHLAGPISQGGGNARARVDALVRAGARYHGLLSLEDLADLYASCRVGLIPYVSNRYTAGVSPLKTFEYLAAGLSVVSIGVPSVVPEFGCVLVAESRGEFVNLVCLQEAPSQKTVELRAGLARENSWARRGIEARELIRSYMS